MMKQYPYQESEELVDRRGTWTPGITFGGAAVGLTFSTTTGKYTKIGRVVHIQADIRLSAKGSSAGLALITGLPFTVSGHSPMSLVLNGVTFADAPVAYGNSGTTTIVLAEITNAGVLSNLTDADFADTSSIFLHGSYHV